MPADGRNPWCVIGSLRKRGSFATDALQLHGLATRAGGSPAGLPRELPGKRLQHEHSMVAIQDATLPSSWAESSQRRGFFGLFVADHPRRDVAGRSAKVSTKRLALPEAVPGDDRLRARGRDRRPRRCSAPRRCSTSASWTRRQSQALFPARVAARRASTNRARCLSFFHGDDRHVVLRAKELRVQRPHGHLLRTGRHTTPDESALTSTAWMSGVFHSMVTQGHVSINRFLSTVHSYLGLFRSHGQRVFVEIDGAWQLLDVPSAFEMSPRRVPLDLPARRQATIHVRSEARSDRRTS